MIGQRLLHYSIIEKLGEGGMGVVYKARDAHLDRFVAIKVLPPEKVSDPTRKARFIQEAKAASALNHPNIITIYDISSDNGVDFIAMEYVDGKTLDQMIARKGMRLNEALKIAIQIADALTRAHTAGIIHRDLKPANIMVDHHGQVKVLDFGLAKLTEQGNSPDDSTATAAVQTDEGTIAGTPAYMSPEQAEGKPVDARSDIFSFGSVLYEMVTGRRAFTGDSKMSTLAAVLHQDPAAFQADVPRGLQRLVSRCLKKDRDRRLQVMLDVEVELLELREDLDSAPPGRPTGLPPRRGRVLGWAAATVILCIAAAGWYWRHGGGKLSDDSPSYHASPFTSFVGLESDPALSPDGNQVAFTWGGQNQDNQDIYVRVVGTGMDTPHRITSDPAPDYNPEFSPDGRWIAFLRDTSGSEAALLMVSAVGGFERRLAVIPGLSEARARDIAGRYLTWAPDGKHLVFTYPVSPETSRILGLAILEVGAGALRLLARPEGAASKLAGPAFSPDGSMLAYVSGTASVRHLHVAPVEPGYRLGTELRQISARPDWLCGVSWTAGGDELVFSNGVLVDQCLWRVKVRGGTPRRVEWAGERGFLPAISRSGGRLVYQTYGVNKNIWRQDLTGPGIAAGPPVRLIASSQYDESPAFSPDGRRIAFISAASGSYEVWIADADGQNRRTLTSLGKGTISGLDWSPDGNRITFASNAGGDLEVYSAGAGGGPATRLASHPASDLYPHFSRDGRWVYFGSRRGGRSEIWKAPAEGGPPQRVTRDGGLRASESPDGSVLYFTEVPRAMAAGSRLMSMPVGGGEATPVLGMPLAVHQFHVVQDGIYFVVWPTTESRTRWLFHRFSDRSTRTVLETGPQSYPFLCVSDDGRRMLFTDPGTVPGDIMLVENFR